MKPHLYQNHVHDLAHRAGLSRLDEKKLLMEEQGEREKLRRAAPVGITEHTRHSAIEFVRAPLSDAEVVIVLHELGLPMTIDAYRIAQADSVPAADMNRRCVLQEFVRKRKAQKATR